MSTEVTVKTEYSREELYTLVWSEPMLKIAEKLEISSSYMARVCALMNVPRPPRGYWAKLEVGKAPPRPELPVARPGDELTWSRDASFVSSSDIPSPPVLSEEDDSAEITIRPKGEHHLVRGAKALFERSRASSSWDPKYLKPYKQNLVDIVVSQDGLDKALKFANALFQALELRKHPVALSTHGSYSRREEIEEREYPTKNRPYRNLWCPGRCTVAYFGTVEIGLSVIEMSEEVKGRYINGKFVREKDSSSLKRKVHSIHDGWETAHTLPSGRLRLLAYAAYWRGLWKLEWQETREQTLTSRIAEIVKTLERSSVEVAQLVAEGMRQAELERKKWEEDQIRWEREAEEKRIAAARKESKEELLQIMAKWAEAKRIKAFFEEVGQRIEHLSADEQNILKGRLALAAELIGDTEALTKFLTWKSPEERLLI